MSVVKVNYGEEKKIKDDVHFVLSHYIKYNPEMIAAIVYGKQRLGKTIYAMQVAYDIYRDWDVVQDNMYFKINDVLLAIRNAVKENRIVPIMIWDDAGVYGSKYLYFNNKRVAMLLQGLFDVVGTAVKCFLMTTPNAGNLLKSIRDYEFYRIKIAKANDRDERAATGYANILLPSGTINIRKEFIDTYRTKIPDDVYARYVKIRKSYLGDVLDNLDEYLIGLQDKPNDPLQEQVDDAYQDMLITKEYIAKKMNE